MSIEIPENCPFVGGQESGILFGPAQLNSAASVAANISIWTNNKPRWKQIAKTIKKGDSEWSCDRYTVVTIYISFFFE